MLLRFETRGSERLNFALIETPCKIRGGWAKFPSEYWEQSSTLSLHFLDFRYVAPFGSQSASKSTGVESRGKISHCLTPVKISGGVGEMSQWILRATPRIQSLKYTFDGAPVDHLGKLARKDRGKLECTFSYAKKLYTSALCSLDTCELMGMDDSLRVTVW